MDANYDHPGAQPVRRATRVRRVLVAGVAAAVLGVFSGGWGLGTPVRSALADRTLTRLGGFHQVAMSPWLDHGKPVVLFVGAQYCPFCATERWALVLALGRFGRWSGLSTMHSTPGSSGWPGIATYDLLHAAYGSSTVALQEREVADSAGRPLQALTAAQARAVNVGDPHGSIPFLLIAGRYAQTGAGYSAGLLVGLSFARIHHLVYAEPASRVGRAVTGEANVISALICQALEPNVMPVATCRSPAVQALLAPH